MQLFVLFTGLETKLGQNRDLGGLIDAYLWDEDARREMNEIIDRRILALYRSRPEAEFCRRGAKKTKGLVATSLLTLVIIGRGGGIRTRDPLHPI